MRFFVIDEKAERERAEAVERSEQDRARREAANHKPTGRPADWKAYRRVSDDEVNNEILSKQQKGRI